jgi:hypothetical protein
VTPVTPEGWADQVDPPFDVPTITPLSPVATQTLELAHAMPQRLTMVDEFCGDQVIPPSRLTTNAPVEPTAKQVVVVGQAIVRSGKPGPARV